MNQIETSGSTVQHFVNRGYCIIPTSYASQDWPQLSVAEE